MGRLSTIEDKDRIHLGIAVGAGRLPVRAPGRDRSHSISAAIGCNYIVATTAVIVDATGANSVLSVSLSRAGAK